ncbi:MAG: hypothetical protein JXB50_02450 [Spirochaetes bacterium]|nr:hypothetical protein [Spirochaetota bacterium]
MSTKVILKLLVTIIMFFIIGLVYLIYYSKIEDKYNKTLNKIINEVHYNIMNNKIDEIEKIKIPGNTIITLWMKSQRSQWIPIIVDKKIIRPNILKESKDIPKIPSSFKIITKQLMIDIRRDGYNYLIWSNRFNYNFIVKNIILLLLYIIAGYIILIMIFELLINPEKTSYQFNESGGNFIEISNKSQNELLNDYKNLWSKNFKISNNFKNNFPFVKIYNLISLTIKPIDYLKECLQIAQNYFQWNNSNFYIFQNNIFFDIYNNETLKESYLKIAENSSCKGDIYIPLYPYNKNNIFGFLYFNWTKDADLNIADIIYLLKFIFSDKAKNIFIFENEAEKVVNIVNQMMEKDNNNEVFFSVIKADNREKIINNLKVNQKEKLNKKLKELINSKFNDINFAQINDLFYIFFGECEKKEVMISQIKDFISNIENQNFNIDNEYGNIAITYSCGVSFKNKRNIHAVTLIKEAEANFNNAENNGGNMVLFN